MTTNKNDLDPTLATLIDRLATECADAQAKADSVQTTPRQHMAEAAKNGDLADAAARSRYFRTFTLRLTGLKELDGPAKNWPEDAQKAYATARQWVSRGMKDAGMTATTKSGKAKAPKKGAQQDKAAKGKEEKAPTPQAAWDRLQLAALQLGDGRARAACQKSLAAVAKHLALDAGE